MLRNESKLIFIVSALLLMAALSTYVIFGYHAGFIPLNTLGQLFPNAFWAATTLLGDTYVAVSLTFFLLAMHKRLLPAALIATLPATIIAQSFKRGMPIDRPSAVLDEQTFNQIGRVLEMGSFPSGHTMTAAVLVGLFIMFSQYPWQRMLMLCVLFIAGISRVMVGAHWPVDIMVGAAVGLLSAWLGYYIAHKYNLGTHWSSQLILFILPCYAAYRVFTHDGGYPQGHGFAIMITSLAIVYYLFDLVKRHRLCLTRRIQKLRFN
ncbi:phosphatase PAP2 family protein [Catenovulum sediminis]|uniref:undecaprenyl-diphosphate phosphatase n=1 Tax=Catenovulum sediminis TaxID=1740262 RepID=A0ABV1RDI5_9ALTE